MTQPPPFWPKQTFWRAVNVAIFVAAAAFLAFAIATQRWRIVVFLVVCTAFNSWLSWLSYRERRDQ